MLKDHIQAQSKIHSRDLRFSTHPLKNGELIIHGELEDTRYIPIFHVTGVPKEPGTIHHISFTCRIAPNPLRIVEAEAEMITVPLKECQVCLDKVKELNGMEIKSGFSHRVDAIMGKTLGCTHLCTLIKAMAQEMVHGWLTWHRKREPDETIAPAIGKESDYLVDSCRIWKKGGIRTRQLKI